MSRHALLVLFFFAVALPASFTAFTPRAHAFLGLGDIVTDLGNIFQSTITAISTGASEVSNGATAASSADSAASQSSLNLKEYVFDQLAYVVAHEALHSLIDSVVNWVGSGFDGSPGFVTDLDQNLLRVGDTAADRALAQLASDGRIDSPFRNYVTQTARNSYYSNTGSGVFGTAHPYTLHQQCANDAAFLNGDFLACGISGWVSAWVNPQNNPIGSGLLATDEVMRQVGTAQNNRVTEAGWGNGFLSSRSNCGTASSGSTNTTSGGADSASSAEGTSNQEGTAVSLSSSDSSLGCPIQSPGSTLQDVLSKSLGSSVDQYIQADELNEVVGALVSSLIDDVLTKGLSQTASDNYNRGSTDNSGTTSSVVSTLSSSIRDMRARVVTFQTNWTKIAGAITGALAHCATNTVVIAANDEANAALAKATASLTALDAIQAKLDAAAAGSGNQTAALMEASQDYQTLVNSGTLPTPAELSRAALGSQSSPSATDAIENNIPVSLYDQMHYSTTGACPVEPTTDGG